MARVWLYLAYVAISGIALANCANREVAYYTPPDLPAKEAVTLLGSKDPKFFLQSSEYHLVWAVDGKPVKNSAYRWGQPLLITADEPHRLSLAYGWGAVAGGLEVELTGKPGTTVVIKGENVDPDAEARLWLEDRATGQILGEKLPVRLAYRSDPTLVLSSPSTDVIATKALIGKF